MKEKMTRITWIWTVLLLWLVWLFVAACADSSTKGDIRDVETDVTIKIEHNYGEIKLSPDLALESKSKTSQKTKNQATQKTPTDANISVIPK
ncbi:hypothetical protein DGMP_06720 [Desulfomarina profundi]|uniref:Lipoprotein n=1 Tax=Desulfomarina profundi TaxID=2772557 RepID=A0A8D5FQM0_9BACT|nr:hypothetical protein [Desulfomarina profundi]BCL59979.1 hypothetical protein DGMP_06720 [Desulfomarina profundi]